MEIYMIKRSCFLVASSLFLISTYSCEVTSESGVSLNDHLIELGKFNGCIKDDGWKVLRRSENDTGIAFDLNREKKDTTERLIFHYYLDSSNYFLQSYSQIVLHDDITYTLEMDVDTLFYYKSSTDDNEEREFIVGEYNYRFMRNKLNSGQRRYYYIHRDSLSKVRGDGLKPLSELKEQK